MLAFIFGVLGTQLLSTLCFVVLTTALAAWLCYNQKSLRQICVSILILILGCAWAQFNNYQYTKHLIPHALEKKSLTVTGYIASIPVIEANSAKFRFAISKATYQNQTLQSIKNIKLSWYNMPPNVHLSVGDKWQFSVKLKRIHGYANPGSANYERVAIVNRLHARGYVYDDYQLLTSHWYFYSIDRLRQHLHHWIITTLADPQPDIISNQAKITEKNNLSNLLSALFIGVKQHISEQQWYLLQATGTNHLMAISGLHVGIVAGFAYWLATILWRRSWRALLFLPSSYAGAITAMLAALFYSLLAGFSLPTQRALLMISVACAAKLMKQKIVLWDVFIVTLFLVLVYDPLSSLSAGFWLSFMAVALLIYGFNQRLMRLGTLKQWVKAQWIATVGLLPITLLYFKQSSLIGWVANMLAIPWVGFTVLPVGLIAIITKPFSSVLSCALLKLSQHSFYLLWIFLTKLSQLTTPLWHHAIHAHTILIFSLVGVILLLAPKGFPGRWLAVIWLFPMLFLPAKKPTENTLWLTVLDVGQGLSVVLQTQSHVLLYDAGPHFYHGIDAGKAIVVPFLQQQGIYHIDKVIISHGDNDHSGGINALAKVLQLSEILTSVPQKINYLVNKSNPNINIIPIKLCQSSQYWQWDGVKFRILHPSSNSSFSGNNNSCVLQVQLGMQTILLPGDIEKPAERQLIKHYGNKLAANILIAPHHGSRTSSTKNFLAKVEPDFVIFSLGYLNRYRFPSVQVVRRYQGIGAMPLTTAKCGAIKFKISKRQGIESFNCYRQRLDKNI